MAKLLKLVNQNILFLGIAFLLLFIPLYPKFPLVSVSETYVSIRLEDFFVAAIVAIYFIKLFLAKDFSVLKDNLTRLILLYFCAGLLSIVSGLFITKNIVFHLAFLHFLRRVEYISLFFVAYSSFSDRRQLRTFGWMILLSTFGVIFYGLGQKFLGWPVVSTMNKEFSKGMILRLTWWARVNSTFAGHYDLAAYLVMILCLVISALLIVKQWRIKILIIFLGIFSYYLLILTASRVSFVAYLVGGLFVLFFAGKKWWIIPFLALSILGMVFSDDLGQRYAATFHLDLSFLSGSVVVKPKEIALVLPTATPTPLPTATPTPLPLSKSASKTKRLPTPTATPTPVPEVATPSAEYFEPTTLAVSRSTDIRLKVEWPRAILAFAKNPLLGTGYSSITLATDNDYLRMLGETGLVGSLAFLLVILEIFRRIFVFLKKNQSRESRLIILGISGAAIGYFLNATFIDVLESSKIAFFFWIMMGVALKVIDINKERGKLT